MSEKIQLGKPEVLPSSKVRYQKTYKGNKWKSTAFPNDSRRSRQQAWHEFCQWRDSIVPQLNQQNQQICPPPDFDFESELPTLSRDGVILAQTTSPIRKTDLAARKLADELLASYRIKAETQQLSYGRYDKVRCSLQRFVDWFGDYKSMAKANEDTVRRYSEYLNSQIQEGLSQNTISDDQQTFRIFVTHVCDQYDLVTPRTLNSKRYRISRVRRNPQKFSVEQVKILLSNTTEETELCLLLMLNCGLYQGDLAEMTSEDVDWKNGRIIMARKKKEKILNKKKNDIQKVNWILWDRTFELLKKQGNRSGLVLLNQKGDPLVTNFIKSNGKVGRTDAVKLRYGRLIKKLKNRNLLDDDFKLTLKHLRKTGANILQNSDHAAMIKQYLDHSDMSRAYIRDGEAVPQFDEAIRYVGNELGLLTER